MFLELKRIKKYFPIKKGFMQKSQTFVKAVDNVDLSMTKGENLGLVGESGSGKTTLGRVLLKLFAPSSGEIVYDDTDITRLSTRQMGLYRQDIQMVFQDPYSSLDPRFTVRRLFFEAMSFDGASSREEKEKKISDLLTAVNLPTDILERYPHEFSGGERQRIAIARALAMNPKLLILDESVSSLDVLVQEQIIQLLLDLQKKFDVTYLFISHNLRVVKKLCSKIAVMYKGKIVELANSDEIFNNPIHPYTQELLSAAINYKSLQKDFDVSLNDSARLVDRGNGHFVIGEPE